MKEVRSCQQRESCHGLKTAVWKDMIPQFITAKNGLATVAMKTTGNEKAKRTVCFSAKADGTKLKPFMFLPVKSVKLRNCKESSKLDAQ